MAPYIEAARRPALDAGRDETPQTVGELTYVFTRDCDWYVRLHGESFATYAHVLGALEATKLELYRRQIAKYEDGKLLQHGDCYGR